jgi:hypothetical protein
MNYNEKKKKENKERNQNNNKKDGINEIHDVMKNTELFLVICVVVKLFSEGSYITVTALSYM